MKKVMFISSTGGHLTELMQLSKMFDKYNYHIVTEKTKSNLGLKNKYKGKDDFSTKLPNLHKFLIYNI